MRLLAKTLLVVLVMTGLALPKSFSRTHEVGCNAADACATSVPLDLADLLPADDCPLADWPTDCGGCEDHSDQDVGDHPPCHSPLQDDDGGKCPHHHHHHHQCVCLAANAWLISDADKLSLQPPLQGDALARAERKIHPDSPVFLLDRPPMA